MGAARKYLLYAVGEIALVVIGILIALQINNWNSHRIELNKEQVILKSLHCNLVDNLIDLNKIILHTKIGYNSSFRLLELIDPSGSEYSVEEVDSLLAQIWFYFDVFDPTTGIIDEIINSGQLHIIQNERLKNQISNWLGVFADEVKDASIASDYLFNVLIIYLTKYGNLKDAPIPASLIEKVKLSYIPASNFPSDYDRFMTSLEFENIVTVHSINLMYNISEYENLKSYFETTIELL